MSSSFLVALRDNLSWDFTVNEQFAFHSCSPGLCQSSGSADERNSSSGDQLQCFLFIFSETASCSAAWTVAQALLLVLLSFQFLDLWLMNKACPLQKLQNQVRSKKQISELTKNAQRMWSEFTSVDEMTQWNNCCRKSSELVLWLCICMWKIWML